MPPATKVIVKCQVDSFPGSLLRLSRQMHNKKLELVVNFTAPTFHCQPVWLGSLVASERLVRVLTKLPWVPENEITDEFKEVLLAGAHARLCSSMYTPIIQRMS